MSNIWKLVIFIIFSLIYESTALYEDQVGKFDWKLSYVGKVKYSHIEVNSELQRVFVSTENNVVAALGLKKGNIIWRHLLEKGIDGRINLMYVGSEVVTISGNGPYLIRGWNKNTGLQVYEWSFLTPLASGEVWSVDQNKVYIVKVSTNSLELTSYHARSGNMAGSTKTITGSWIISSERCAISEGILNCVSETGDFTSFTFSNSKIAKGKLNFPVVSVKGLAKGCLLKLEDGNYKAAVFKNEELVTYNIPSGASVSIVEIGNKLVINFVQLVEGSYEIQSILVGNSKINKYKATRALQLNEPESSSSGCIVDKKDELLCFIFISAVDDSAILINKDKIIWAREEALANVISVEMVDLPVSEEEAAIEKEFANKEGGLFGMFTRRISSQIYQSKSFLFNILGLKGSPGTPGVRQDLVRDPFGLHKLMILVTKTAKIYGMDNNNGEIVWQTYVKDVSHYNTLGARTAPIFVQRTARHLPLSAMATILFKNQGAEESVLYVFNPITGQPLVPNEGKINYNNKVDQCLLLPTANEQFIYGLLMLFENGKVEIYPESTTSVALEHAKSLYLYTANQETGLMKGHAFYPTENGLNSIDLWTLKLPEKIVAVVGKTRGEKVHSQGRVLGDRSVLYKYSNPNLVAIASISPDPVNKFSVSIFLVDTVKGAVVFSTVHRRATGPVHVVHSENWVVYSFFNDKNKRTEIVTLDLYEGNSQRNTTAFSSLDPPIDPFIGRQTYIFPHHVSTMKETITEKGITNKHVLVGLLTGGVMEVPWALLDPRRTVMPTAEMREEGVLPYIPELMLPAETIITYNNTLLSIEGIHTSPAGLESTSLVLVYGLDLFYTRVAPSKTFDVLKDDFEYWLITAVLSALITAAYVSKRLASRKALKQAWK